MESTKRNYCKHLHLDCLQYELFLKCQVYSMNLGVKLGSHVYQPQQKYFRSEIRETGSKRVLFKGRQRENLLTNLCFIHLRLFLLTALQYSGETFVKNIFYTFHATHITHSLVQTHEFIWCSRPVAIKNLWFVNSRNRALSC